jgi:threonine/homoserine/homoserine lactone efflux protein
MVPFTPGMWAVLGIWLLAVVSPGPAFLVLSQAAAGRSRATAFGVSLGIALVAVGYAALTMCGLAIVVAEIGWLMTVLRLAGGLYLVYLGLTLFTARDEAPVAIERIASRRDFASGLRTGVITAAGNPKAIAFFLSLFVVALPHDLSVAAKVQLLASGFVLEMGWYSVVGAVLSTAWVRGRYARARATINRVLGSALVLAGIRVSAE